MDLFIYGFVLGVVVTAIVVYCLNSGAEKAVSCMDPLFTTVETTASTSYTLAPDDVQATIAPKPSAKGARKKTPAKKAPVKKASARKRR